MHASRSQDKNIIGIMADSHGQTACLQDALTFFQEKNCNSVYHLGDICDSAHPESADACVHLLQQHNVLGVKGNNDHQVAVNHMDSPRAYISAGTIEYLQHLPLTLEIDPIVLAHSLPFIGQRGLSSMVGTLGENEIGLFFHLYPRQILMRGHSHLPELIQSRPNTIFNRGLIPGEIQPLTDIVPAIITCGAVDHGFVMIWDQREQALCSYKL